MVIGVKNDLNIQIDLVHSIVDHLRIPPVSIENQIIQIEQRYGIFASSSLIIATYGRFFESVAIAIACGVNHAHIALE